MVSSWWMFILFVLLFLWTALQLMWKPESTVTKIANKVQESVEEIVELAADQDPYGMR